MEKIWKIETYFKLKLKLVYDFNHWYSSSWFFKGKGPQLFVVNLSITIKLKSWAVLGNVGIADIQL